nr:mannosyl-oligosaccharide alpha-1,2-mannosidase [Polyrhizophydium stewartii]
MISNPSVNERREQDNRRRQNQREDIVKHLQKDTLVKTTVSSDNRVEQVRRLRTQKLHDQELQTYESLIEDERKRREIEESIQFEEQIVSEMERIHHEQVREQKQRQSIRENSVELRELEKKLNYAYMNKERAMQLKEKQLISQQAKACSLIKEAELIAEMSAQAERAKEEETDRQKQIHERSIEYHKALHNQLAEAEVKKQQEYEQFLKEKAIVDEIVKRILEENEREAKIRLEKQRETKQFVEDFMKERERWHQMELERQELENQRIEEYARLQREREQELENKKKTIEAGKNAIYDKLAAEMQIKERAKLELEELRIDLAQEEQEAAARRRDQEILQQRIRKRLELIDAYQMQVRDKKLRLEREREEEEHFRHKMMQKFAEDDRLDQLNQQKRRMKQLEHKRAVDALVEERRRIAHSQAEEQRLLAQKEIEVERYRQAVIEQERQRLLREHAAKLVGFLPKGVLRDDKDLDLFDEDFRKRFEKLSI